MQCGHLTGKSTSAKGNLGASSSLRRLDNLPQPSLLKCKEGWGATFPKKESSSCTMLGGGTTGPPQHSEVWSGPSDPKRSEVGQQVHHCSVLLLPQDTQWMGTWLQHPWGWNEWAVPALSCWQVTRWKRAGLGSTETCWVGAVVLLCDSTGQQGWLCRELSSFR